MPLREPRLELDRQRINKILGWSGVSIKAICSFVRTIPVGSNIQMASSGENPVYIYNRGEVTLEDTGRRPRECYMISIWSDSMENKGFPLFQQPIPIKLKFFD